MRSQTSERAKLVTTSLRYKRVTCVQVHVRKFRGRLPRSWPYLIKVFLLPLSVCIGVCPSNATEAPPISTATASVEARDLHLHPLTFASKAVLSSWSLVVVCALITREKFQRNWNYRLVPGSRYQALYTRVQQYVCTIIYGIYRYQSFTCSIRINI